jgi:serine/threonine protein kinase
MEGSQKLGMLDNYVIEKLLGSGANAKVFLGYQESDPSAKYAIKLVNDESSNDEDINRDAIISEAKILQNFKHHNIIKMYDLRADGVLKVGDKVDHVKHLYCVMQIADKGVMLDYLMSGGLMTEPVARYYFKQMVDGLIYIHNKGYAHRDLKPDNLLLGSNYELLIADFGHSTLLQGKKGDGKLSSKLGTPIYNAPEVGQKQYEGKPVDTFMAGVCLFIFLTANTPFKDGASKNDPFYKNFLDMNPAGFWSLHEKRLKHVNFNPILKDLLSGLFTFDPTHRPTLDDVTKHPWWNQPTASDAEVKQEMHKRFEAEERRKDEEIKKAAARRAKAGSRQTGPHKEHNRDVVIESDIYSQLNDNTAENRDQIMNIKFSDAPPAYEDRGTNFFNTFYSSLQPEALLKAATVVANNNCKTVTLNLKDYTVNSSLSRPKRRFPPPATESTSP